MRRLKSLFLILLVLWLPIQAAGAVVMPWQYAQAHSASAEHRMPDAGHCQFHDQPEESTAAGMMGDCDNCRICHLATTGFLLAPSASLSFETGRVLFALPYDALPSHIGDPPLQPPRPSN